MNDVYTVQGSLCVNVPLVLLRIIAGKFFFACLPRLIDCPCIESECILCPPFFLTSKTFDTDFTKKLHYQNGSNRFASVMLSSRMCKYTCKCNCHIVHAVVSQYSSCPFQFKFKRNVQSQIEFWFSSNEIHFGVGENDWFCLDIRNSEIKIHSNCS